jgi:hypothetical protein
MGFKINALRLGDTILVISSKQSDNGTSIVTAGLLSSKMIAKMNNGGNLIAIFSSFIIDRKNENEP